jgi:hypothetical protein
MAAFADIQKQTVNKLALGLSLQFFGFLFFVSAVFLSAQRHRISDAREEIFLAGVLVTTGWTIEQWQAGRWPRQAQIRAIWETRAGNLILSLTLAASLSLFSVILINTVLRIGHL